MREAIIEVAVQVIVAILLGVVSIAFAYIGKWMGKTKKLETVATAMDELERTVKSVVGDLQQTMVDKLKEASENHKLSPADIEYIGQELIKRVADQLSLPAANALNAAGCDIESMIHSMAESFISKIKRGEALDGVIIDPETVEA